jgi:hypothetical protein
MKHQHVDVTLSLHEVHICNIVKLKIETTTSDNDGRCIDLYKKDTLYSISLYEQVNFKKIGAKQLKYVRNVHSKYVFLFAENWS